MLAVILILWGASAVAVLAMLTHHCWRTRNARVEELFRAGQDLKAAWRQKDEAPMTWRYFQREAAPPARAMWMTELRVRNEPSPLRGYGNLQDEALRAAFDTLRWIPDRDDVRVVFFERTGADDSGSEWTERFSLGYQTPTHPSRGGDVPVREVLQHRLQGGWTSDD